MNSRKPKFGPLTTHSEIVDVYLTILNTLFSEFISSYTLGVCQFNKNSYAQFMKLLSPHQITELGQLYEKDGALAVFKLMQLVDANNFVLLDLIKKCFSKAMPEGTPDMIENAALTAYKPLQKLIKAEIKKDSEKFELVEIFKKNFSAILSQKIDKLKQMSLSHHAKNINVLSERKSAELKSAFSEKENNKILSRACLTIINDLEPKLISDLLQLQPQEGAILNQFLALKTAEKDLTWLANFVLKTTIPAATRDARKAVVADFVAETLGKGNAKVLRN